MGDTVLRRSRPSRSPNGPVLELKPEPPTPPKGVTGKSVLCFAAHTPSSKSDLIYFAAAPALFETALSPLLLTAVTV